MDWSKLKPHHIHNDPVPYIHAINLIETKAYDRLYENQNNLNHQLWQEFDEKHRIGFEFKEDIKQIDTSRDVIAIWCFKERSDRTEPPDICIAGKKIAYYPNAVIVTRCKDISIIEKNKIYIRRPFVQLDMSKETFDDLMERRK